MTLEARSGTQPDVDLLSWGFDPSVVPWLNLTVRAVHGALLYGTIGACVGLILGAMLADQVWKRGWLMRTPFWWRQAARLHLLYIPLVVLFGGASIGAVYGTEGAVHASMEALIRDVLHAFDQHTLGDLYGHAEGTIFGLLGDFQVQPQGDGWVEQKLARGINYFSVNFAKWMIVVIGGGALAVGGAKGLAHMDADAGLADGVGAALSAIQHFDLSRVDATPVDLLVDYAAEEVTRVFSPLYLQGCMMVLLLLSIVAIDYGIHAWYRTRPRQEATA